MALVLRHLAGVHYACYVHGEDLTGAATSREYRWLGRRVLRGADYLIPNSRNTERLLCDGWGVPPARSRLMHPGVDTERFRPSPRDPGVRSRLGWAGRPVVLTVGRLQRRKGHDQMILALDRVRRDLPDVLYAIVGDGEERDGLQVLAAQRGLSDHVQFLGEVDEECLIRCFQQCDLFVLPNRQVADDIEGFGMVLLEAQACGKPVLAGSSGGTAETMCIPRTGLVVPCDGPGELAEQVAGLLSDRVRLERMGQAARSWAVERFDWGAIARRAERHFSEDLTARPPGAIGGNPR
jgi:phosphatidylinositol alpha-1,6-mannosyltransferase